MLHMRQTYLDVLLFVSHVVIKSRNCDEICSMKLQIGIEGGTAEGRKAKTAKKDGWAGSGGDVRYILFFKMGGDNHAGQGAQHWTGEGCSYGNISHAKQITWRSIQGLFCSNYRRIASLFSKPCPLTTLFGASPDFHLASRGDLYARAREQNTKPAA